MDREGERRHGAVVRIAAIVPTAACVGLALLLLLSCEPTAGSSRAADDAATAADTAADTANAPDGTGPSDAGGADGSGADGGASDAGRLADVPPATPRDAGGRDGAPRDGAVPGDVAPADGVRDGRADDAALPSPTPWPGCKPADRQALAAAAGESLSLTTSECFVEAYFPCGADELGEHDEARCFWECLVSGGAYGFDPPIAVSEPCAFCLYAQAVCIDETCASWSCADPQRRDESCDTCLKACHELFCACAGADGLGCGDVAPAAPVARCDEYLFVDTAAWGTARREDHECPGWTIAALPGPEVDVPTAGRPGHAVAASLVAERGGAVVLLRDGDGACVGALPRPWWAPPLALDAAAGPVLTVDGVEPVAAVLAIDCPPVRAESCDNGADDDYDGAFDCADPDCEDAPACCVPDCEGRACGDDGCGSSCGSCGGDGWQCVEGACVCVPWGCEGRECGQDGCGATCGVCPAGQACAFDGRCVDVLPVRALRCGEAERWSTAPERGLLDAYACADTRDLAGPEAIYTYRSGAGGTVRIELEHPYEEYGAPIATLVVLEELDATRCVASLPLRFHGDAVEFEVAPDTRYAVIVDGADEPALFDIALSCRDCQPSCAAGCGDDGCGAPCPSPAACEVGERCDAGVCRPCAPRCGGRACGSDGCGGTCGACPASQVCVAGDCVDRYPFACAEGESPPLEWTDYTYRSIDDEGRLVLERSGNHFEGDHVYHAWHYDALGRLVRELGWSAWRSSATIYVDDLYSDTFDEEGRLIETRVDRGRDGTVDEVITYGAAADGAAAAADGGARKAAPPRRGDAPRHQPGAASRQPWGGAGVPVAVRDGTSHTVHDEFGNVVCDIWVDDNGDVWADWYSYACWPGATAPPPCELP